MKKRFIVLLSIFLVICTLQITPGVISLSPALAETADTQKASDGSLASKEEVIYSTLTASGEVKEIYAVNILNISKAGTVRDYGSYSLVKNLTTTDIIKLNADSISVNAAEGRFYYQGNLISKALPWNIAITYLLDGKAVNPDTLAGESGHLEIQLSTTPDAELNPVFYQNYLLQITVTLDTGKCSNISASGATLANAGSDKLITFNVMPSKEGSFSISTDIRDFEMKGISLSGIPFSPGIELPDTSGLTSDLTLLSDAILQLKEGISSLGEGISQLNSGTQSLNNGSSDFKNGLDKLSSRSKAIVTASSRISSALTEATDLLSGTNLDSSLSSLGLLPKSLSTLSSGLDDIAKGLSDLGAGYSAAYTALDEAVAMIPEEEIPESSLQLLMIGNPDDLTVSRLIEYYSAARRVKGTYQTISPAFSAVASKLRDIGNSVTAISGALNQISTQIASGLESTDLTSAFTQLSDGIAELSDNYKSFHKGLSGYTDGVAQLAASYSLLNSGITDLSKGTAELDSGTKELVQGSKELADRTGNMPQQIETAVNDITSAYDTSGFTPVSFTSPDNAVASVQFVLQTEPIRKPDSSQKIEEPAKNETFWTRLRDLFTID